MGTLVCYADCSHRGEKLGIADCVREIDRRSNRHACRVDIVVGHLGGRKELETSIDLKDRGDRITNLMFMQSRKNMARLRWVERLFRIGRTSQDRLAPRNRPS